MARINEVKSRPSNLFDIKYQKLYKLGKGNFGKVYLAENRKTGEQFAVKVVDKRVFKSGDQKQHAQREQKICETFASGLEHKNVVNIHEVISDNDSIYIVMEHVEGGELFEKIKKSKGLAEPTARRWFREIIEAVEYIHKNKIVHRDLKPENVLIDRTQRIRICDFGFGNIIKERHEVLSTYCGSPFYAAPEMVTATPYHGPPVDLWSCGVILYAMLTGSLPFQSDEMPQLFHKISQADYTIPPYVTRDASDLIKKLLCRDAKERITAKDCLLHPWLAPPTMSRCSALASSQLSLSSHRFQQRKKISKDILSNNHEDATKEKVVSYYKPSQFFIRLFRKTTQIVPATDKKLLDNSQQNEKKIIRSKYLLNKFTGLFKITFQKRIVEK